MEIPIQNIYYLLCYAWNKLEAREIIDIQGIDSNRLSDLFARVLIGGTARLLKMGLDRGYLTVSEEVAGIKGKIDFGSSLKKNLLKRAKAQCEYDELSYNVPQNQILKSTLRRLSTVDGLDWNLKEQLLGLISRMPGIDEIPLNKGAFRKIQLHRNNSFYEFLLKICELVIDNLLPSERKGSSKFRDFLKDEKQMASLFEEFVRNFYRLEQKHYKVYREDILWDITAGDRQFLPKMQTDISLENSNGKIVIDTKYYREALTVHYEKERIRSENMYQMFAYLKNLESTDKKNANCAGILLYPTVTRQLDINMTTHGHPVSFKTINLNQDWLGVHHDLLSIVGLK